MGLGDLLDARLIVAGCEGMEDGMSDDQRGKPVTGRLPPTMREA